MAAPNIPFQSVHAREEIHQVLLPPLNTLLDTSGTNNASPNALGFQNGLARYTLSMQPGSPTYAEVASPRFAQRPVLPVSSYEHFGNGTLPVSNTEGPRTQVLQPAPSESYHLPGTQIAPPVAFGHYHSEQDCTSTKRPTPRPRTTAPSNPFDHRARMPHVPPSVSAGSRLFDTVLSSDSDNEAAEVQPAQLPSASKSHRKRALDTAAETRDEATPSTPATKKRRQPPAPAAKQKPAARSRKHPEVPAPSAEDPLDAPLSAARHSNPSTKKNGGRKVGAATFKEQDVNHLLDLVEELRPVGMNSWLRLADRYNTWASANKRPHKLAESLRRKYNKLVSSKKPTGDPDVPPEIKRAKRLNRLIEKSLNICDIDDRIPPEWDDDEDEDHEEGSDADADASDADRENAAPAVVKAAGRNKQARARGHDLLQSLTRQMDPDTIQARENARDHRFAERTRVLTDVIAERGAQQEMRELRAEIRDLRQRCDQLSQEVMQARLEKQCADMEKQMLEFQMRILSSTGGSGGMRGPGWPYGSAAGEYGDYQWGDGYGNLQEFEVPF